MNKNAETWVAALRSGKYSQTRGVLRDDRGYCCLGVACQLYADAMGIEWNEGVEYRFDGEEMVLPLSVKMWLGLNGDSGRYYDSVNDVEEYSLAKANDDGMSFGGIASIIESEPDGLFIE